jgi:agmatinase
MDLKDIKIFDAGDLHIGESIEETLKRLECVTREIVDSGKTPVILGGEHTISYGVIRAIGKNIAVVSFDAHMDLRREYMGEPFSHASTMRRVSEFIGCNKIFEFGVRAFSREEIQFASTKEIWYMPNTRLHRIGLAQAIADLEDRLASFNQVYITIDMDVLDPAYAPGVGNPEGNGMDPNSLIQALCSICRNDVCGIDLVEITPQYDHVSTAIQGARVLFEVLCAIEHNRKQHT